MLLTAALVLIGVSAAVMRRHAVSGWNHYRPAAARGPQEAQVERQFLSQAPREQRFAALFGYFAQGFIRHADVGFGRVQYDGAGSVNGFELSGLEGFTRTASLLAAWVYGGRPRVFIDNQHRRTDVIEAIRSGILSGVDPGSSHYWGRVRNFDQIVVEAADLARVLWLTRADIWASLPAEQHQRIIDWLLPVTQVQTPRASSMLFPVLVDLLLVQLAPATAAQHGLLERAHHDFDRLRGLYLEGGWFSDQGVDFSNAWGITYELLWMQLLAPGFEPELIGAAVRESGQRTAYLISPQGIPIMGRSICYRTAVPVPLLAVSLLEPADAAVNGRARRALEVVWRYFVAHGSLQDGALTQGYFGPDLRFLDPYSGPGSCQWGLRSLVLAFMHGPAELFWTGGPRPLPVEEADFHLAWPKLGWVVEGHRATGEITIEIAANPPGLVHAVPYSAYDRLREAFLLRPFRPLNHEIEYDSRFYSSARPFPLAQTP